MFILSPLVHQLHRFPLEGCGVAPQAVQFVPVRFRWCPFFNR